MGAKGAIRHGRKPSCLDISLELPILLDVVHNLKTSEKLYHICVRWGLREMKEVLETWMTDARVGDARDAYLEQLSN